MEWNECRSINPASETAACWLDFQCCSPPPSLCISKLNCCLFLDSVRRQHILQSVLIAIQDECKLTTN